jgi:hypothetical protein
MSTSQNKVLPIVAVVKSLNSKFKDGKSQLTAHETTSKKQSTFYLGECFDVCLNLEANTKQVDKINLIAHYTNIVGKEPTPKKSMTSIVLTCVFDGLSNSQKHAYKAVIDFAITTKVGLGGFVKFVESHGGLDATRKAKYVADRAKNPSPSYQTRVDQAKAALSGKSKSIMPAELRKHLLSGLKSGEKALLYVTVNNDGTATYNEVIVSESAVKAAEQAYYKAHKDVFKVHNTISKKTSAMGDGVSAFEHFELPEFDLHSYNTDKDGVHVEPSTKAKPLVAA